MSRQSPKLAHPADSAPTPTPTTDPNPAANDDSPNETEDAAALLERKKLRLINQITQEFTQYLEETTGYTVKREDQIEESEFNPTTPSNADTNKPDPGLFVITFFDITETAPADELHGNLHEHAIECRSVIAIDYKNDVSAPINLEAATAENEAYA